MDDAIAFAEELEDVALQLSSLNPLVEEPDEVATTVETVVAEYERLGMTAAMYGQEGVQQATEWISEMLVSFQETLPEAILELLQGGQLFGWIELTAIVLREPEELSHLPALSAELMSDAWPEPPAPELMEKLLVGLRMSSLQAAHSTATEEGNDDATAESLSANASGQPNLLAWDADIHPELLEAYMQETPGQIAEAARLIHLIAKGSSTPEQKRHAARLAHTVKGASGVVGVSAIAEFTHRLEDILELDINRHLPNGLGATLEAAADCLESLFDHLQENKPLPDEYSILLAAMDDWEQRLGEPATDTAVPAAEEIADLLPTEPLVLPDFILQTGLEDDEASDDNTPVADIPRSSSTHLSVPMETVQRLLNLAGELITSTSQIAEHAQQTLAFGKYLQQQDEHVRQMLDELGEAIDQQSANIGQASGRRNFLPSQTVDNFDQLELEAYNDLHSTSSLLTESIADNRELTRNLQQQIRQISDQVYQQQRLQRQLSETILRTRLVPVQAITARVERTVRETCRRTGKNAVIRIHGQNLQIDTDILQGLTAPLLHMLRNAIDHGIELPEERNAAGKDAQGHVELRFEQKGSHIHMTLKDDGRGLDTQRIRTRAIERKLIQPDDQLKEEDILRLILQPGFTTRDQVSEISGRGVGMDVVQTAVENLQGLLHLDSKPGQGTSIHIQVPLTLIATNALLVRTGGHLVAIPGSTIQQLLYVSANEHLQENGQWSIQHQETTLHVMQLAHLLGWQSTPPDLSKGQSLLLMESEHKLHALHVDEILQPRDIVVKSLAPWINITQGVSGACILANGTVAPVLDTLRLLRSLEQGLLTPGKQLTTQSRVAQARSRILIVDDSLSNRKSLSLMVEHMGYQAITAVDGLEALQRLHENPIELVLTDLEMPRMNGLEMTQAIRIWPEKRHIPVIMITSRSTLKHRQMAHQAGVDDYLTKPVSQDTLNTQLDKWLRTQLAA
ncbi:MAG TPA: response regulator [Candidatus Thiothrix moscowensis]|uniref:hybrid sensor histidine kinase/response regulator n=1 Tax=unclassified Thiothrix TaxID=2636184 RepID=UPI0025EC5DD4|nr:MULTISPECIES: response regulator [unclassified Thiothrix]HRJ52931.1 response regulator [Candidatus Thiothrix moscowensis]HRJ93481.1 response regulator [Candidatus Thiothrix moscowensis]